VNVRPGKRGAEILDTKRIPTGVYTYKKSQSLRGQKKEITEVLGESEKTSGGTAGHSCKRKERKSCREEEGNLP